MKAIKCQPIFQPNEPKRKVDLSWIRDCFDLPKRSPNPPPFSAEYANRNMEESAAREAENELDKPTYELVRQESKSLSKRLGLKAEDLAHVVGYWVQRVPHNDRWDMAHDLAIELIEKNPANIRLAFAVARGKVSHYWAYQHYRQHISLDAPLDDDEQTEREETRTLANVLVGLAQFERMESEAYAEDIMRRLPPRMRRIIADSMNDPKRVTWQAREWLRQFAKLNANAILTGDGALKDIAYETNARPKPETPVNARLW